MSSIKENRTEKVSPKSTFQERFEKLTDVLVEKYQDENDKRKEKGEAYIKSPLTQVAEYLSTEDNPISTSTLSQYRTGQSLPRIDGLASIAKKLNVSVDYLLGLTDKENYVKADIACAKNAAIYIGLSQSAVEQFVDSADNGERLVATDDEDVIYYPFEPSVDYLKGFDYSYRHIFENLFKLPEWNAFLAVFHHLLCTQMNEKVETYFKEKYPTNGLFQISEENKRKEILFRAELNSKMDLLTDALKESLFKDYLCALERKRKDRKQVEEIKKTIEILEQQLADCTCDEVFRGMLEMRLADAKQELESLKIYK